LLFFLAVLRVFTGIEQSHFFGGIVVERQMVPQLNCPSGHDHGPAFWPQHLFLTMDVHSK
jgi:hypothetical protein